ncbi:MAG: peptide chain release factor N(5)-glutamine methyltransferase [Clostridia bacterium]|nr:peptide chain release factor N(5)-glutamine methyltransferase [Clostridia bacterium]
MTVREASLAVKKIYKIQKGERFFTEKALLSALFEKRGLGKNAALNEPEKALSEAEEKKIFSDAEMLLSGYPIQYYLGTEYFCGEEFLVSEGVLIPRPETELLVEKAVLAAEKNSLVWDLCCGSGCVGIALLLKRPDLSCVSFDLSPDAVVLTKKNRSRFGLDDRLSVVKEDVFSSALEERLFLEKPSLILSNPPYLTAKEMNEIPENVAKEPQMALFGGEDGLLFYRRLLDLAEKGNVPLLAEMGAAQKEEISNLLSERNLRGDFYRDFSEFWRVFHGKK